jgi:transcription initiation factor TFIID subunit 10
VNDDIDMFNNLEPSLDTNLHHNNGMSATLEYQSERINEIEHIDLDEQEDDEEDEDADENENQNEDDGEKMGEEAEENNDDELNEFFKDAHAKTPGEILEEFSSKLKDINTTLPDSVINHYMKKAGFVVNDPKLVKLVSIASQKFISEIVNDVMQHHRLRSKSASAANATGATSASTTAAAGSSSTAQSASASAKSKSTQPLTLTLEDLSNVLTDYGINVKKPYYFM